MKHIYEDHTGWRILIQRRNLSFRSFITFAGNKAAALQKAMAVRDEFLAAHGGLAARSNTGVSGVTELTHWTRGFPQTCFVVTMGKPCRNWKRRFFYRTFSQREAALQKAIAHRQRLEVRAHGHHKEAHV